MKLKGLLIFLLITNFALSQTTQREGVFNDYSSLDPQGFRRYTWVQDSIIITEVFEFYTESDGDSIIKQESRIRNYTITDLTTGQCQDYFQMDTSAPPITNYIIERSKTAHPYDKYVDSLILEKDTLIEGKAIQRAYFILNGQGWAFKITYGLDCQNPSPLYGMLPVLKSKFPNCKLKYILYQELLTGESSISITQIIRGYLTDSEKSVFKQWRINLLKSDLPTTNRRTATKLISRLKGISAYHR